MPSDAHPLIVVAAVIERDGQFLVTRRLKGTHLADFWEFPGGKCEPHETHEACLARELMEELDVQAEIGAEILSTEHAYPDRSVRLHFLSCRLVTDPRPMLGQEMRWVPRAELRQLPFPEADRDLIEILTSA